MLNATARSRKQNLSQATIRLAIDNTTGPSIFSSQPPVSLDARKLSWRLSLAVWAVAALLGWGLVVLFLAFI